MNRLHLPCGCTPGYERCPVAEEMYARAEEALRYGTDDYDYEWWLDHYTIHMRDAWKMHRGAKRERLI